MNKGTRWFVTISLCFAIGLFYSVSQAQQVDITPHVVLEQQIDSIPTQDLEGFLSELNDETRSMMPQFNLKDLALQPEKQLQFDMKTVVQRLLQYLFGSLLDGSSLLIQVIVIAIVCAVLRGVAVAFHPQVAQIALLLCLFSLVLLGFQSFRTVLAVADGVLNDMVNFMHAFLPIMVTLLAAVGGITSAAIFHPVFLTIVIGVATFVKTVLFPLAYVIVALLIAANIAVDAPLSRLAKFVRTVATASLGVVFVVFMGVLSIRGAIGPVVDGLGIKTAKFLTGTFIPIVGGRLADAFDVVISGSLLLKNTVGAFGMLAVLAIVAFPALQIAAFLIIFRLAAVFIEPVAEEKLTSTLVAMGDGIALVLACVLTVGLMFFVSVTALVTLGNATAVMR